MKVEAKQRKEIYFDVFFFKKIHETQQRHLIQTRHISIKPWLVLEKPRLELVGVSQ